MRVTSKILTVKDRWGLGFIGASFTATIIMSVLMLTDTHVLWYFASYALLTGICGILAYLGKNNEWDSTVCIFVGALGPIILMVLLFAVYLPGNVLRYKKRDNMVYRV